MNQTLQPPNFQNTSQLIVWCESWKSTKAFTDHVAEGWHNEATHEEHDLIMTAANLLAIYLHCASSKGEHLQQVETWIAYMDKDKSAEIDSITHTMNFSVRSIWAGYKAAAGAKCSYHLYVSSLAGRMLRLHLIQKGFCKGM